MMILTRQTRRRRSVQDGPTVDRPIAHRQIRHFVCVVIALAFVSGCRGTSGPASNAVSADTWAVVDGHEISRSEVDKSYQKVRDPRQTLSDEEIMNAKLNLLNDLIVQQVLLAKAETLKLTVAESEVDTAYADAKKDMTDEAFQKELSQRGLTMAELREGFRRELLSEKVIDQEVKEKSAVSEQEVTDFFNANRTQFNIPEESYHIAQIVVTPVRERQIANSTGDDAATPEAATAKVKMLMERLQGGAQFPELAAAYSEDPDSARRGGDLGFVPVSSLKQSPPALRDAVLNKAPGTATVATVNGVHTIAFVLEHEYAGQKDLSSPGIKERITERLRTRREQLLRAAYITTVRTDADVVNYLARHLLESKGRAPGVPLAAPGK